MMGFSVLFIFALLQICTLCDGGNSEDLSNISDSSNHHHHLHPRAPAKTAKAEKDKDQSPVHMNTYLEFVESNDPPENAALVPYEKDIYYYILGTGKCEKETLKASKITDTLSKSDNKEKRIFLVNKDNFEIFEWKKWADVKKGRIRFNPIIICKSIYMVKDSGIKFQTIDEIKQKTNIFSSPYVLTVNYDIQNQDFQIDNCEEEREVKAGKIEVIKRVTADNKNCKSAKHVLQFDQGSDNTISFEKSRTHAFGAEMELSASGNILGLVEIAGKVTGKYDYTRLNSETTSNLETVKHSMIMEIEIPPNHSCNIEIKSNISTVEVQCSGQLTRLYKNGEERSTSVTGAYKVEVAELLTSMNPCNKVPDGAKC